MSVAHDFVTGSLLLTLKMPYVYLLDFEHVFVAFAYYVCIVTQLTFTFSKSTIETLGKVAMFKVNNKNTRIVNIVKFEHIPH